MFKTLYKELQKELLHTHKKAYAARWKKDLEKTKAKLTYDKLQLFRNKQSTAEVDRKLKELGSGKIDYPALKTEKVRELIDSEDDLHNLQNVVTYLKNQREYTELLERYNPGLTMSQEDNVRKTANKVGLSVPEN